MKFLILFLSLIFAPPIWAADGDASPAGYVAPQGAKSFIICDGKTGNVTCSPRTKIGGIYERVWIEVADEAGCSAYTVTLTTVSQLTGGVEHVLGTLSYGTDTMLALDGFGYHPLAYVEGTTSGVTGCTNLDVLFHGR